MSRRSRGAADDSTNTDESLSFKYGQVVWASSAGFPVWPARIDFIPIQMNPDYKNTGLTQYPVFFYGSHSISWVTQDVIYENNASNYAKYLKAARNKLKNNDEQLTAFEAALDELETDPCISLDLKTVKDLQDFFDGKRKIDCSHWIEEGLINLKYVMKGESENDGKRQKQ